MPRFGLFDAFRIFSRFLKPTQSTEPPPKAADELAEGAPEFSVHWVDWRDKTKTKKRGKRKGSRNWSAITGITLHQTAANVTNPERCLNMPVHGVVMEGGPNGEDATIILLHDPTDYMYHGNGFNRRDIGIEVCCRAAGIEGDPDTLWLPKKHGHLKGAQRLLKGSEATDAELEACRRLVRYYTEQAKENGGEIEYIHAHRQATKNRVSDPGSRIWRANGEWARETLGLKVGPADFKISDGKALPDAWTGRANGVRYNWKVDGRLMPSETETDSAPAGSRTPHPSDSSRS